MYDILFTDLSKKQFLKLPKNIQERIKKSLERIRIRPYSFIKKLVGSTDFSLRVGDYRVFLDIDNNRLVILVLELGHRKNIYK